MPCSRNFRHCCIIDVVGPHPFVRHCTTRYAVTISSVRTPSRSISCHANWPRGSFPCFITLAVSFIRIIWAMPPGWLGPRNDLSCCWQCAVTSFKPGHHCSIHCLMRPVVSSYLDQFLFVSCRSIINGFRLRYRSNDSPSSAGDDT